MNRAQKIALAGGVALIALVNIAIPSGFSAVGAVFFLLLFGVLLLAYVKSLMWVYQDARARHKSAWMVTLLVAILFWPCGLLLWAVFRPERSRRSRRKSSRRHPESSFTRSQAFPPASSDSELSTVGHGGLGSGSGNRE